jgi:hypothetical protein
MLYNTDKIEILNNTKHDTKKNTASCTTKSRKENTWVYNSVNFKRTPHTIDENGGWGVV